MRAPHLHLFGWDTPHCPIKIKLPPLRLPQLTWSDENIWRKPQRRVSCRLPVETINGAEQRTNSHRVNDSGAVIDWGIGQDTAQVHGWIPFRPARCDGIAKNHAAGTAQPPCRFVVRQENPGLFSPGVPELSLLLGSRPYGGVSGDGVPYSQRTNGSNIFVGGWGAIRFA